MVATGKIAPDAQDDGQLLSEQFFRGDGDPVGGVAVKDVEGVFHSDFLRNGGNYARFSRGIYRFPVWAAERSAKILPKRGKSDIMGMEKKLKP